MPKLKETDKNRVENSNNKIKLLLEKATLEAKDDIPWIRQGNKPRYIFRPTPIDIDSDFKTLWKIMTDVEQFNKYSHGAVSAHIEGDLSAGKMIELRLYKDQFKGKFLPKVKATVTVVDENLHIVCWSVKFPFGLGHSKRYQLLEETADKKIRSYILDQIPGPVGFFTKITMDKLIKTAFNDLNNGMKAEAEAETQTKRMHP